MPLSVCVLASGSSGNSVLIRGDAGTLLIDAGLSGREMMRRLDDAGVKVEELLGVCLTHEHDDHRSALPVLHRRHGVPLYANAGTVEAIQSKPNAGDFLWNIFTTGARFSLGGYLIDPFSVPHDSFDPVGFVVSSGSQRIGVVTDMGMATSVVRERLRGCDVIVLEANHDEALLQQSSRPWSLKQRILGRQGHLSNSKAGELICEVAHAQLRSVFLAHISRDCNTHELAYETVSRALQAGGFTHVEVKLTYASRISDVVEL